MKISKTERIFVELDDSTRLMERASKRAVDIAIIRFGIDDCGHSSKVKEWARSDCSIRIKFEGMDMRGGMGGWGYVVSFTAWCEKSEE